MKAKKILVVQVWRTQQHEVIDKHAGTGQ